MCSASRGIAVCESSTSVLDCWCVKLGDVNGRRVFVLEVSSVGNSLQKKVSTGHIVHKVQFKVNHEWNEEGSLEGLNSNVACHEAGKKACVVT